MDQAVKHMSLTIVPPSVKTRPRLDLCCTATYQEAILPAFISAPASPFAELFASPAPDVRRSDTASGDVICVLRRQRASGWSRFPAKAIALARGPNTPADRHPLFCFTNTRLRYTTSPHGYEHSLCSAVSLQCQSHRPEAQPAKIIVLD